MGNASTVQPLGVQPLLEVIGDFQIVQVGKGLVGVALDAYLRKEGQCGIATIAVDGVYKMFGTSAGYAPDIHVENIAGLCGDVVAIDD